MPRRTLVVVPAFLLFAASAAAQATGSHRAPGSDAALLAQETSLYDALARHDAAAFNAGLGSDFMFMDGTGARRWKRSETEGIVKGCTLTKSRLDDAKVTRAAKDVRVVTYRWSGDETCNGHKSPSPVNALSVWRWSGGRWVAVSHSESPVVPTS